MAWRLFYSRQIEPVGEKYILDHYHAYGGPKYFYVSAPTFVKKVGQRIVWSSRIEVKATAYRRQPGLTSCSRRTSTPRMPRSVSIFATSSRTPSTPPFSCPWPGVQNSASNF